MKLTEDHATFENLKKTASLTDTDAQNLSDIRNGEVYKNHIIHERLGKLHQTSYCLAIDGVR